MPVYHLENNPTFRTWHVWWVDDDSGELESRTFRDQAEAQDWLDRQENIDRCDATRTTTPKS